jgi:hemolysin III
VRGRGCRGARLDANTDPIDASAPPKPRLRGVLHQWAAVFALGAGWGLVALAPGPRARLALAVYAASLLLLFAVSAVYHRFHWTPRIRKWLRRADHAAIYLLIGGTYTPIALLALDPAIARQVLTLTWSGVALGVLVGMLWPGAPKFVGAAIAVAVGWTIVPYAGELARALTTLELWLVVSGGLAYSLGAVVYAVKRPDPWPATFGYHELFHALTLVGAGLHLAAILEIVRKLG